MQECARRFSRVRERKEARVSVGDARKTPRPTGMHRRPPLARGCTEARSGMHRDPLTAFGALNSRQNSLIGKPLAARPYFAGSTQAPSRERARRLAFSGVERVSVK